MAETHAPIPQREKMTDERGVISRAWYQFLYRLFGTLEKNIQDLQEDVETLETAYTPIEVGAPEWDAAYVHASSDGKDHSDVILNNTHRVSDGKDHSDVVLNTSHRGSDGKNHSDVVLNNTHRSSDGKNHSDVVLNNAHRESNGSDHSYINQDVTTTATPTFDGVKSDDAVNVKEITTPGNPSSGYKKIYPKADGKLYTLNSAGEEVEVGSGSGSLSIYGTVKADDDNIASFTDGLSNATFALETTTPISGDSSYKITFTATSSGTLYSKEVDLYPRSLSKFNSATTQYNYDGDDDDLSLKLQYYNGSSWADVQGSEVNLESASIVTPSIPNGYIPDTATKTRWVLTVNTANDGKIIHFNDIEFSDDPFISANFLDTDFYNASLDSSINISTVHDAMTKNLVTVSDSTTASRITITANRELILNAVGYVVCNDSTSETAISQWYDPNGNIIGYTRIKSSSGSSLQGAQGNISIKLSAGQSVEYYGAVATGTFNSGNIHFTVEALTEHFVVPIKSSPNDFSAKIQNNGTATIISQGVKNGLDEDVIASLNRTTTGTTEVTWTTDFFDEIPCVVPAVSGTGNISNHVNAWAENVSTTGCTVYTSNSTGSLSDVDFTLFISRQNSDVRPVALLGAFPTPLTAYIKDVKTSGTGGGNSSAVTVHTRTINTVFGDTDIVILGNGTTGTDGTADQFTLGSGKFIIEAKVPVYATEGSQAFIYRVDDTTYVADGGSMYAYQSGHISTNLFVTYIVTLAAPKTFEIRHWTQAAQASGLGVGINYTNNPQSGEVYTEVKITKVK